ncbi:hypothetical protein [Mucilaginibacter antarcticus]|uniref:hypothetical protein n=1 Tax=Mucilaginibacter antarcticus TaxID=1855725 RepID=UPI00362D7F74
MFIFPLIFIISFVVALREVYRGKGDGIFIFLIFGLSMYTTAMSVTFLLGLKAIIPAFQFFKEVMVLCVLTLNVMSLRQRPKFHLIDYLIFAFLGYTFLYVILPIGEHGFLKRLLAFKSTSFYIVAYFTGRLFDPKAIYINKYFNYIALLTIGAGAVLTVEVLMQQQLQLYTGFAEYCYYFFNIEPNGSFGLTTTFESEGGIVGLPAFMQTRLNWQRLPCLL